MFVGACEVWATAGDAQPGAVAIRASPDRVKIVSQRGTVPLISDIAVSSSLCVGCLVDSFGLSLPGMLVARRRDDLHSRPLGDRVESDVGRLACRLDDSEDRAVQIRSDVVVEGALCGPLLHHQKDILVAVVPVDVMRATVRAGLRGAAQRAERLEDL